MDLRSRVIEIGRSNGLDDVGVARAEILHRARRALVDRKAAGLHDGMQFTYKNPERSTDPFAAVDGARSVIVGARSYQRPEPDHGPGPHGRVARYAWEDHYRPLRDALWAIAHDLRGLGYRAVAYADDNTVVDREVASRAGIGWFGKNANLLLPERGSWFVLGCVITDAEITPSTVVEDGCGSCRRCLDGCPTGAIIEPGVIDARRCLAWLVQRPGIFPAEYRVALGDRIYGCDDCQDVCPVNRRHDPAPAGDGAGSSVGGPPGAGHVQAWVPLVELLGLDDTAILSRYGRWYLHDREPRWLRRNALIALGNAAGSPGGSDGPSPDVVGVLGRYLGDPDPILRAHAVWAIRRLGLGAMLPNTDPDPSVRAELSAQ